MNFNWLFFAVLAIFAVCIIVGWNRGFVRIVFSLAATIVSLVLTLILCPLTINLLKTQSGVYDAIYKGVDDFVDLEAAYDKLVSQDKKDDVTLEEKVDSMMESIGLPSIIRKSVVNSEWFKNFSGKNGSDLQKTELSKLEKVICENLTATTINALGFIITLIVVMIALFIISKTLDLLTKLPVLHQVNTWLGIVAGAAEGLLIVWIFFTVVTMFAATEFGQNMLGMITENQFLQFLYDKNVIALKFFS